MDNNTSSETEKNPKVLAQEEKNAALRAELKELEQETAQSALDADDQVRLTRLSGEERRLQAELEYQKQLKAARTGKPVAKQEPAPSAPAKPDNKKNTEDGKSASENGKDK